MNGDNFSGQRIFVNKTHRVIIKWEVKDGELTIQGELHGPGVTWLWGTFLSGGQCSEEIAKAFPENATVQQICKIWDRWHLNHTHAGNQLQEDALREWQLAGNKWDYDAACAYLKSLGLYETTHERYGSRWYQEELPESVLATVKSWEVPSVFCQKTVLTQ